MTTIAHRFTDAFNSRDVAALLAVFTPDVRYDDIFYGMFEGRDGLRELFGRMYAEGVGHEWTMTTVVEAPNCTIGEWHFAFTVSAAVLEGSGQRLAYRGTSVFETAPDGRCHTYREHFDRAAVLHAMGLAPVTVHALVRRRSGVEVGTPAG